MSLRPIIIVVSILFIGFIVLQWMSMKSSRRRRRRRGFRARRRRQETLIVPRRSRGPSPWAMLAGLVMTVIALGLALFWRST